MIQEKIVCANNAKLCNDKRNKWKKKNRNEVLFYLIL